MTKGINKVILIGNLGSDPVLHATPGSVALVTFNVATSETWKDKANGQQQERTEWHRVIFFNRMAELATNYLRKGSKVYIEGTLRTRKWQDKNGIERYTTEVVGSNLQMLDTKNSHAEPGQYNNTAVVSDDSPPFEDDIPF